MPENKRPLKVFLCHASADKPKVRELYRYLRRRGIQPWLDAEDLVAGQNWRDEIPKAIRASEAIIICLSKNSINKEGYVQAEITFALEKALDIPAGRIFIIPARFEDCEVPHKLEGYHWVDLFEDDGFPKLMKSLKTRASQLERATVQVPQPDESSPNLTSVSEQKVTHEKADREIAEKLAIEGAKQEEIEKARLIAEEEERQKLAKEKEDRETTEKLAREKAEQEEIEKARLIAEEEERQKLAKEKADREAVEKAALEKAEQEEIEKARLIAEEEERQKLAKEKADREAVEKAALEKAEQEEIEKARLIEDEKKIQKLAKEKTEQEVAREKTEQEEIEKLQLEIGEKTKQKTFSEKSKYELEARAKEVIQTDEITDYQLKAEKRKRSIKRWKLGTGIGAILIALMFGYRIFLNSFSTYIPNVTATRAFNEPYLYAPYESISDTLKWCVSDSKGDVSATYVDVIRIEAEATGEKLMVNLFVNEIPESLPFNKSTIGVDEEEYDWTVRIDVDGNQNTGDSTGTDYNLSNSYYVVEGESEKNSTIQAETEQHVWKYKSTTNGKTTWQVIADAELKINYRAGTITLIGSIPGLNKNSRLAFYTSTYDETDQANSFSAPCNLQSEVSLTQFALIKAEPSLSATSTVTPTSTPTTSLFSGEENNTLVPNCEAASYISETIPDGTEMMMGQTFVKSWRFKNTGSCTWVDFSFVFYSGDLMGALPSLKIETLNPGEEINITVDMTAPSALGNYRGYWQIHNASGAVVPMGSSSSTYIDIVVIK